MNLHRGNFVFDREYDSRGPRNYFEEGGTEFSESIENQEIQLTFIEFDPVFIKFNFAFMKFNF